MAPTIKNLFQIYGREKTLVKVLSATAALRASIKNEGEKELSPECKKLKEKFISFGPPGAKWAELATDLLAIMGIHEDLTIKNQNAQYPFVRFACVSPLVVYEGHNYKIGEPFFLLVGDGDEATNPEIVRGIKKNGSVGNNIKLYVKNISVPEDAGIVIAVNCMFDLLVAEGFSDKGFGKEEDDKKKESNE